LKKIAATKAAYVSNASPGARYLEEMALSSAGVGHGSAFGVRAAVNVEAVKAAASRGAYVIWGVPPFLRWKRQQSIEQATDLESLVTDDPTLQRIMVSIVVNPKSVKGVNAEGAQRLQSFLLTPAIQARIAAFRYPDFDQQVWWPSGRHNSARD